ncbi:MAG TPA: calcium/sodium antiporter [Tenuifilaceae bacterium]|jgi:cation:H+ antiporter|nr:calcium/sodium antiporter [Tenuifilaceae bacterium]
MLIDILLFSLGLVILIVGANWLVDGASSIASSLGVSALTIGLTVVAAGTSTPELVVNIVASVNGTSGLAMGNVLGSNIMNILLIVGIAAIISPIHVQRKTLRVEIPFTLLAAVMLLVLGAEHMLKSADSAVLSRLDGVILLIFFGIFFLYTYKTSQSDQSSQESKVRERKPVIAILLTIAGIAGLYFGGVIIVDSATEIAGRLGVSDAIIGLTVVAIGTSLPELVTSSVAAYKGNSDIAIGNVVGSNIFNIFLVLGVSCAIRPLPFYPGALIDILVTCAASILLFLFVLVRPKQTIERTKGTVFLLIYIAYLIYLIAQV